MAGRVLILGASARAAAASARRAGLEPFALDLFADRDTRLLGECLRCPPDEYPEGLFRLAKRAPPMPWLYTGGLENYPELIGELAAERELWGNGPDVLAAVRDPFRLLDWCDENDSSFPPTLRSDEPRPPGRWLRKRYRSAGGLGVRWANEAGTSTEYFQEYIDGEPVSAVFRSAMTGPPEWLGATRQLVGTPWLHAGPFRYAGNVSLDPGDPQAARLGGLGDRLAESFRLYGVWGIDCVHTAYGPVLLEVNPRYPGSAEVIEFATGTPAIWNPPGPPCFVPGEARAEPPAARPGCVGKAVYYAPHRVTFPETGPWDESLARAADVWRRPDFADVPHPGEVIEPGHPVLTLLADADTEADCLARLQSRAAELDRLFGVRP